MSLRKNIEEFERYAEAHDFNEDAPPLEIIQALAPLLIILLEVIKLLTKPDIDAKINKYISWLRMLGFVIAEEKSNTWVNPDGNLTADIEKAKVFPHAEAANDYAFNLLHDGNLSFAIVKRKDVKLA